MHLCLMILNTCYAIAPVISGGVEDAGRGGLGFAAYTSDPAVPARIFQSRKTAEWVRDSENVIVEAANRVRV